MVTAALLVWELMTVAPSFFGRHALDDVLPGMLLGLIPVFTVSFVDDVRPVRAVWKLTMQCIGAVVAVGLGVRLGPEVRLFDQVISLGPLALPLSVLWIVGVTNAFNLADGLDGLSAGLALVSAVSLAALGVVTVGPSSVSAAVVLVGALIGFLPSNVYPAKVFLGDVGATSIGFCLACLGLRSGSNLSSGMAVLIPIFVTGVPLAETVLSIIRRILRRAERLGRGGVFEADTDHIHNRLLNMGLDHRRAVLLLYGANTMVAALGLLCMLLTSLNAGLVCAALLVAAFIGIGRLGYDEFAVIRRGVLLRFYDAPVLKMSLFPVFFDMGLVVIALYLSIGLKYDDWSIANHRKAALDLLAILPLVTIGVFWVAKLYRGSWRHASVEDLVRAGVAVIAASAGGLVVAQVLLPGPTSPSFFCIYAMVLLLLVNSTRSSFRILSYWRHRKNPDGQGVVIYGAGRAGAMALREILTNEALGIYPIGFIDDDPAKAGRYLNGYAILGSLATLGQIMARHRVKGVVVASEKISHEVVGEVRRLCGCEGIWLMRFRIGLSSDEPGLHVEQPAETGAVAELGARPSLQPARSSGRI